MRLRKLCGLALGVAAPVLVPPGAGAADAVVGNAFFEEAARQELVLVDKAGGVAYLVRNKAGRPRVVRRFDGILVGENRGDKLVEGDKRTPEGVYFIQRHIPASELPARYGDGAFPTNYPNIVDRIEGKTGYGIWLHGIDETDKDKDSTKGCVAFRNDSLNALRPSLEIGTPVLITREADFLSATAYRQRRQRLLEDLRRYLDAWEGGDTGALERLLHPDFRTNEGQDAESYLAEQRRLMSAYPRRRLTADNVRVLRESAGRIVYAFDQLACAPSHIAYGRKRLYFKRTAAGMRLVAEEYRSKPAWRGIRDRVRELVTGWKREREDPGPAGDGRRPLASLRIREIAGDRFLVGFDQGRPGASGRSYGVRTLVLKGCPGAFRVAAERWRPLP